MITIFQITGKVIANYCIIKIYNYKGFPKKCCPPSTTRFSPVMYWASVEARNTTALAISRGSPTRRRGAVFDTNSIIALGIPSTSVRAGLLINKRYLLTF